MGHLSLCPLDNSTAQKDLSELVGQANLDALQTVGVHPISYQFWQHSLCNVHWLWQLPVFRLLPLNMFKDLFNQLLTSLEAANVSNQFDN